MLVVKGRIRIDRTAERWIRQALARPGLRRCRSRPRSPPLPGCSMLSSPAIRLTG